METAKDAIERLLLDAPDRMWDCVEMASLLKLTIRTVAREVGALCDEGVAYRHYGRQRKLTFKAAPQGPMPKWLDPFTVEDVETIIVVSSRKHFIEDD